MKVLHIIGGGDIGGAKVHVINLVRELGRAVDIKLVSLRPGSFADDARAAGIDVEVVKTGNIFKDIGILKRIIRKNHFEIIHSHGAKANLYSFLARRRVRLPAVTTVHSDYRLDYMHSATKRISFGLINTIALRFIDYHIGVSDNFHDMLIKRKFNPENVFTLYNGMDFSKEPEKYPKNDFLQKYKLNIHKDDIIIGILGRLHPVKDQETFVKAAAMVLQNNPAVKFVIGGEGDYRKVLERKIEALGISGSVFMPGWIDNQYEFMSNIDINVLTSISETFPYVILEGAMYKKATISSDVGGISDLIKSGINGWLFKAGDCRELAGYMTRLVYDGELRRTMGEKIYNKACASFSLENMYKMQLSIYETIIENEKAGLRRQKGYDIILSGYYGFKNIGDDAMLTAIIKNLRLYSKKIRILVLSSNPYETRRSCNVISTGRYNILRILFEMRKSKLFIYGGGTLIQDSTSTRSLFYYLGIIWMARKIGLKVMLYANGIEPMSKKANRDLTRSIVNRVDIITLREELSRNELMQLGINKPEIMITADPALTMEPAEADEIDRVFAIENINGPGPYAGFSARKWAGYRSYCSIIAAAADHVYEKYGAFPVFISMQYPDDLIVIKEITAKMRNKAFVINNKYSAPLTLGIVSRMEILIGMRLHALVFAASRCIPVIGLAYQPKVDWFLRYIKQDSASAGDVRDIDETKLLKIIDDVWSRRKAINTELKEVITELKKKALNNALIAIDLINARDNTEELPD